MKLSLFSGLTVSACLHAAIYLGGLELVAWQKIQKHPAMEIDLHSSSLLLRPPNARGQAAAVPPPEPWILATAQSAVPAAVKPPTIPKPPVPEPEEPSGAFVPPGRPIVSELVTEWVPAAAASRIPEWIDGMITEEDYPADAKAQGKEGQVVATVFIDDAGKVQEVLILEGSTPEFVPLVTHRLKAARFRPALDQNDRPLAVRMTIPIVFKLD